MVADGDLMETFLITAALATFCDWPFIERAGSKNSTSKPIASNEVALFLMYIITIH
jgi:hypothetical protein